MAPRKNRFGFVDSELLKTARARFKFADETDSDQREREKNDLGFYAGDQWPADVMLSRLGQQPVNGMPAVPSRPTLVIDNVREPVSQVVNEGVSSDLGIEITAAEDFGDLGVIPDDTEIRLREGLVRKIQRESQARSARFWAFDRAVKAGRGYYQVLKRYLPVNVNTRNPGPAANDQELYVHRIYNQGSVLLDPSHQEPDGSDAKWGFVIVDMLWEDYLAAFPKNADGDDNPLTSQITDKQWEILGDEYPKWFKNAADLKQSKNSPDKKTRAVRVVEYWYTEQDDRDLCTLADGSTMWSDDVPEDYPRLKGKKTPADLATLDPRTVIDTRPVTQQTIKWCKIDGAQILEQTDWDGPDLPIIKVLGEELQPYDNEWRAEGMIRPARDAQMGLNYMISKQVEMVGLTPLTPLIADPEAIEDYPEWQQLNTRVVPYGRYRSYDDQGRQLREPHRPNADPNLLPISQSIALFSAQIEKQTRVPAARLGDIDPVTRSGKALDRLTANSKNSTSNFMQNLIRSVRYEGQILNNLLYPTYGARPGRLVRIMTGKGNETELIAIHDAPNVAQQDAALMQKVQTVAKLTADAKFNINIKVTRDFDTRREEEHAIIGEIIGADPQAMMSAFGDLYFATMDTPGHQEMAERAKVMLNPRVQAYLAAKQNGQAPTPRELQLQAQLQAAQQQLQQLGMEVQTGIAKERAKGQIDLQKTTVQEQAEDERNRRDNETRIAVAEIAALAKELQDTRALFAAERERIGSQQHAASEAERDRGHEAALSHADAEHEAEQAQMAQQHDASMAAMQSQPPQAEAQA